MKRNVAALIIGLGIGLFSGTALAWEQVLITSNRDGNAEIYLVDLETKSARNLTDHRAEDAFPAWSPNGRKIAFVSSRSEGGVFNLYVMDADGRNVQPLTQHTDKYTYNPSWSPDSQRLLFNVRDDQGIQAMVIELNSRELKVLGDNIWDPVWSPDGKKIAYTKLTERGFKIQVMQADGTAPQDLGTNDNQQGWSYPAWSLDGKKLVFGDLVGSSTVELFLADANGGNRLRLTSFAGRNPLGDRSSFAAWSPDGKRILFRHFPHGAATWPFYWIDPDGKNLQLVESLRDEPPLNNYLDPGRPSFKPQ